MAAICCGVALSPASAAAGSAGTIRISRKVTTSSPNSDGLADNARRKTKLNTEIARPSSGGEAHPAHLTTAPYRPILESLTPISYPAHRDPVVHPGIVR